MKIHLDIVLNDPKGKPFNQNGTTVADIIGHFRNAMMQFPDVPAGEVFGVALNKLDAVMNPLTLGDALYLAISISPKTTRDGTAAERRLRGRIAQKLAKNGEQEFTKEEIDALKEDAGSSINGLILVAIEDALTEEP
jgi:hypothetical protein